MTSGSASSRKQFPIVQPQSPSSLEQPLSSTHSPPGSSLSIRDFFPLSAEQFGPSALSVSSRSTMLGLGCGLGGGRAMEHGPSPTEHGLGELLLLFTIMGKPKGNRKIPNKGMQIDKLQVNKGGKGKLCTSQKLSGPTQ